MGCHALLGEKDYPHSAAATEDSEILFITKSQFLGALRRSPALPLALLKNMAHYVNFKGMINKPLTVEKIKDHITGF